MHPRNLQIRNFTYHLPDDRIARYPLQERDLSKLLVYNQGEISEDVYRNLAQYLPQGSMLFFNNTKVIPARLYFKNALGAKIEILCLEPATAMDMATAMSQKGHAAWQCMIGRANKWKEKVLQITGAGYRLSAEIKDRNADAFVVQFNWQPENLTFAEILDKTGVMPIPPYLHRYAEDIDLQRYQTVYARYQGSVAAPTAGLHFTEKVLGALKEKGIHPEYLTLHVGAGTFKPVKSENMAGHDMHAELAEIDIETLQHLLSRLKEREQTAGKAPPVVAVGTTALRLLESLYWIALKVKQSPHTDLSVDQWQPYENPVDIQGSEALQLLVDWMAANGLSKLAFKTRILIAPGYKLRIADALITNFHQPNSTLLLLVAALLGDDWRKVYDYALNHNFRFLSYGDGSLLCPPPSSLALRPSSLNPAT